VRNLNRLPVCSAHAFQLYPLLSLRSFIQSSSTAYRANANTVTRRLALVVLDPVEYKLHKSACDILPPSSKTQLSLDSPTAVVVDFMTLVTSSAHGFRASLVAYFGGCVVFCVCDLPGLCYVHVLPLSSRFWPAEPAAHRTSASMLALAT
jgi:hypothetical protein